MASTISRKGLKQTALAVALGLCFVGAAIAADTGGLRITVLGNGNAPLVGATVTVSSPSSLVSKTGTTDASGLLNLTGLDPAVNYTVKVVAQGYSDFSSQNVAVVSGKNLSVGYALGVQSLDTVVVTGAALAALDTTSAVVGSTLNLDIVEALPTARTYQGYLQLVPGVMPSSTGNPASKSGINVVDNGGTTGTSTDNVYYLDGINVTDPMTGTFGANFNSEIIQEQQVVTGGVPAEYEGGAGLISKVITKSGSNDWHGSVNYYFQNDSMVGKNEHLKANKISKYDTAATLGGAIVKDKLWFFGSFQKKDITTDVSNAQTGALMRSVKNDAKYSFLKATWQLTDNDRLTGEFFRDPTVLSGSTDSSVLNNRDRVQAQGGDNYKVDYSHDWSNLRLSAYGYQHKAQLTNTPADLSTRNDVAFLGGNPTLADLNQGGSGTKSETWRNRKEYGVTVEYFLDTSWGSHAFKSGLVSTDSEYKESSTRTGGTDAVWSSIGTPNSGATFAQYALGSWTGTKNIQISDVQRLLNAINGSTGADHAYFLGLLDANSSGSVDATELDALQFNSTTGNPTGQVNVYRNHRSTNAPYSVTSKGKAFYVQDAWTLNKWTFNVGLRTEQWSHYASDDTKLFTFKWKIAPRLSAVYDINGDGRSKVWAFGGRYYDPIRNDMTNFAGKFTGPVDDEQIFVGDRWLTYRTRGGATVPDAKFAPATKTPYTDEFMLGYSKTVGENLTVEGTLTHRVTKNIFEDFDFAVYSNPNTPPNSAGTAGPASPFYLPYSYFGYSGLPQSNYVMGTLPGGERKYNGLELVLRKQKSNNWQGMVSYTYSDSKGNTNSDGNADFQGDWIALDPRAPNMWGPQAGSYKHLFKAWGTYFFDMGLEVSGVFNWNSGIIYTPSFQLYGRYLPMMQAAPSNVGGVVDTWVLPNTVGSQHAPSYSTLDVRAKYTQNLAHDQKLEYFLDIFNVLDRQSTTQVMRLTAGNGAYAYQQPIEWVAPRNFYLGVRYSF